MGRSRAIINASASNDDDEEEEDENYATLLHVGLNLDHSEHGLLRVISIRDNEVVCTVLEPDDNSTLIKGDTMSLTKQVASHILMNEFKEQ
jgi:hypothetical protein